MSSKGFLRGLLLITGALFVMAVGAALWIFFRPEASTKGSVLGAVTSKAFWKGKELFVSQAQPGRLFLWTLQHAPSEALLPGDPDVTLAVASSDDAQLIVVSQEGSQNVFWKFEQDAAPALLAATSGDVTHLAYAPKAPLLLYLERRPREDGFRMNILNTLDGSTQQVGTNVVSAMWVPEPQAIISVDGSGQMWFHTLQLSGDIDPPQLLGSAVGSVVADQANPRIAYVAKTAEGAGLKVLDLIRKEERLVTPLAAIPEGRAAQLSLSPDGKRVVLIAPQAAEQENGSLTLIDETGSAKQLDAIGRESRWVDDEHILYERVTTGSPQLWEYDLSTGATSPVAEPGITFSS